MSSPGRSRLARAGVRLIVGLALLFLLTILIDTEEIIGAYTRANGFFIGIAALLLLCNLGFQIVKWHLLLRLLNPLSRMKDAVASFLFGLTIGTLTPGQLGEFGGRAFRYETDEPARVVGLTILDKFQTFGVMMIAGIWSLAVILRFHDPVSMTLLALTTALIVLFLSRPVVLRSLLIRIGIGRIQHRWIVQILDSLSLLRERGIILGTLVLTLLFYLTVYVQTYALLNAFSDVGSIDAFLGFASMMLVKSLIPITLGDLGTREAGMVYFLSYRGIAPAVSFNASLLLFVINLLIPSLLGLVFLPRSFSFRRSHDA